MSLNTKLFTYHRDVGKFTAEISTLKDYEILKGFELESNRTGAVIKMRPLRPVYDNEGETVAWDFWNAEYDIRATIFND